MKTLTCIHRAELNRHGLCEDCRAEFDIDPFCWIEFGAHPAGIERLRRLREEMESPDRWDDRGPHQPDSEILF